MPETILLVDLSSIVHVCWHVSGKEPDPDWTSKSAVAKVHALASAHRHAAVCCDSKTSLRKDLDPSYKANRPAQEEPLRHQMALAIDLLKLDGFPTWMADGYEADDIIATATRCVRAMDDDVLIASADKDLLQLVGPHVTVHSTTSGNRIGAGDVLEKFGVRPDQMLDYLCLVGDSSDNVKGAEGIGPKKAAQILATFGTLAACYAAIDKADARLSNGMEQSLLEFRPRWVGVRELLRLRDDAPVPFEEIAAERVPAVKADALFDTAFEVAASALTGKKSKPPVGQVLPAGPVQAELPPTNDAQFREPATHAVSAPAGAGAVVGHVPAVVHSSVEWDRQLEPVDLRQAHELSKALHASRLFLAYGAPEAILATVIAGRELGLPAMAALRAFHIVSGRPTLAAATMAALVLKSGRAKYFSCAERTDTKATFETWREGDPKPVALTFTIEEGRRAWAKDEKAWKESGWTKYPSSMLVARAQSMLARLAYPDVCSGLYDPSEID